MSTSPMNDIYSPEEIQSMPAEELAQVVIACAIGCGNVEVARVLKQVAIRIRRQLTTVPSSGTTPGAK